MNFEQIVKPMFQFRKTDCGYELAKYLHKESPLVTRVEIPSKYKSHRVKSVASGAFSDAAYLRVVVIPDTVVSIGRGAFRGCEALAEITLPKNLKIIDCHTFDRCVSLEHIDLPPKLDFIRSYAFLRCEALKEITFPDSMCSVYNRAFEDCTELERVGFPDTEIMLLGTAFKNCPKLSAEAQLYTLIGANDPYKPFAVRADKKFDWNAALREDVFRLAIRRNNFSSVDKRELFKQIIDRNLAGHFALAENMLDSALADELLAYTAQNGKTEITARLLNFKNGAEAVSVEQLIDDEFSL